MREVIPRVVESIVSPEDIKAGTALINGVNALAKALQLEIKLEKLNRIDFGLGERGQPSVYLIPGQNAGPIKVERHYWGTQPSDTTYETSTPVFLESLEAKMPEESENQVAFSGTVSGKEGDCGYEDTYIFGPNGHSIAIMKHSSHSYD